MKVQLTIALLLWTCVSVWSQTGGRQARRDSLDRLWLKKADSLVALRQSQQITDSLNVLTWIDTVKRRVDNFFKLPELRLRSALDSVRGKRKKERAAKQKLDSIQALRTNLFLKIDSGRGALHAQLAVRYQRWQQKLDSVRQQLSVSSPVGGKVGGLPHFDLPPMPSLEVKDITRLDFANETKKLGIDLSLPKNLNIGEMKNRVNELGGLSEVKNGLQQAKSFVDNPGKSAESAINQLEPVKIATSELEKSQRMLAENEAVTLAQNLDNPEALQEEAVDYIKQQALDHFAGKEELLQQAMAAMGKHKRKFKSLQNLEALPKNSWLPRNGLKGKAFSERVRIGLHAALLNTSDTLIVDFFPNVSYYLTGRVELGAGVIYRIREVKATWQLDQKNPVWGFSGFSTFKLSKGIRWRLEADAASYPLQSASSEQAPIRIWRWTWLTGIQTNFNISNRWSGNAQMLYNFDRKLSAGFPDFLVLRAGVQYRFK